MHEHLNLFGLIIMNGRMYDPWKGRFLSPDPVVQNTEYGPNYNPYSYCLNNPLKYIDPSGFNYDWFRNGITGQYYFNSELTAEDLPDIQAQWGEEWEYEHANLGFMLDNSLLSFRQEAGLMFSPFSADISLMEGVGDGLSISQQRGMVASSQGGGPGWEAYAGAAASVGSEMFYSKTYGTWMGKNFKMYKQTWGGNGFTGGKNKFGKSTSNSIKWAGRIVGLYSGYKTIDQRINGEIGTGWMLAELGTTGVSTFGGLYGAAWGVGWELGRAVTTLDAYQEFKFNFWYDRWESKVGPPSQSNEGAWYYFYNNYGQ